MGQMPAATYDSDDEKSVFIASIQYNDESFLVDVPDDKSIGDLKEKLQLYTSLSPSDMRLIVRGKICQDAEPLTNISTHSACNFRSRGYIYTCKSHS